MTNSSSRMSTDYTDTHFVSFRNLPFLLLLLSFPPASNSDPLLANTYTIVSPVMDPVVLGLNPSAVLRCRQNEAISFDTVQIPPARRTPYNPHADHAAVPW
jgi:hypothetical protein